MAEITYREALNQALAKRWSGIDSVFLMGEEVAEYDGAYKVSKGLLERFGDQRVVDSPISELGFAGLGVGAAMVGLRPIIEFMTFNFSFLALDQVINSAAKMLLHDGGPDQHAHRLPRALPARRSSWGPSTPRRAETWYVHAPGVKVVTPATPADAKGLLKAAIRDNDPVIFMEGELLYNIRGEVPDGRRRGAPRPGGREAGGWGRLHHHPWKDGARGPAGGGQAGEGRDRGGGPGPPVPPPPGRGRHPGYVAKTNRVVYLEEGWPYAGMGARSPP
jgi:pyruvate dehydrogenase E1 component beta subunit